ncbi:MAG: PqqD family protein [Actinomycetota bacterium]
MTDQVWAAVPGGEGFHCLSGTALAVWDLLEVPRALPELVGIISAAYSVDPANVASDVDGLIDDMVAKGLVEEIEEADI